MKKRAPQAISPRSKRLRRLYSLSSRSLSSIGIGVVAASDSPDKAHAWLGKVWEKDASETELRDPEGFSTRDAKILSGLTNVLEGDFARQTDTYI